MSSRELARSVYAAIYAYMHTDPLSVEERADIEVDESGAAALIDAWVRVREAEARIDQLRLDGKERDYLLESALATARKQLEEKVK